MLNVLWERLVRSPPNLTLSSPSLPLSFTSCSFGPQFNDYTTAGYACLIKKKGLVKANFDRVESPTGEYGCVNMGEFAIALSQEIPRNEASLKAYTRIYAPEAPLVEQGPETLLNMRFVNKHVQGLLTPKTALIVETGGMSQRE